MMMKVRVLLVDNDPFWLKLLEKMLRHWKYEVTATSSLATALQLLKDQSQGSHDLLLGDDRLIETEGSELFDFADGEMDMPVLLASEKADKDTIIKAIDRGVKDFMTKPIWLEQIKLLWLHVARQKAFEFTDISPRNDNGEGGIEGIHEGEVDGVDHAEGAMASSQSSPSEKEHSDVEIETDGGDSSRGGRKKRRVVWTKDLHAKFLEALNMIGSQMLSQKSLTNTSSGAVPRLILKAMNVPELTLQNVASHLQKFRLHMKREQDARMANTLPNQHHKAEHTEVTFPPSSMVNQAPQPSTTGTRFSTSRDNMLTKNFNGRGLTGFRGHNYFRTMGSIPGFRRQFSPPERVLGNSSMPLYSAPTGYQHQFSGWNSSSHMQSGGLGDPYRAPHFDARVDLMRNNILPQGNILGRESTDSLANMGNFSSGLICNTTPPFLANTSDLGSTAEALQGGPVIGGNLPTPSFTNGSTEQMSYHFNPGGQDTMPSRLGGTSRLPW